MKIIFAIAVLVAFNVNAEEVEASKDSLSIGDFDLGAPVTFSDDLDEDGYPFDPGFKTEEEALNEVIAAVCPSLASNFQRHMDCLSDTRHRFVRAGRLRGTLEFVRLNFLGVETAELKARINELKTAQKSARTYVVGNRPLGTLDHAMLDIEIGELQQMIGRKNKRELISDCEEIFGEGHSRCKLP